MTPDDFTVHAATRRLAALTGPSVVGMLAWYDPTGALWIAPLGSTEPAPGSPPPAEWMPVRIEQRTDRL